MKFSFCAWRGLLMIFLPVLLVSCGGGGGGDDTGGGGGTTLSDLVVTTFSAPSSGVAGSSITVSGSIKNQGGTMGVATAVIYLAPTSNVTVDGGQLGFDFYGGFLGAGSTWNFSFTVGVPSNIRNGVYYLNVIAQGDDPSAEGNNVWSSPVPFTVTGGTECSPDSYESDSTAGTARAIALGGSQLHNHCEGTSDYLKFSATAGTAYGIVGQTLGDMASLTLSVYDTNGTTRLANLVSPWSVYSRMTWTAPASGNYYLRVAPYNGTSSSGANTEYRISLGDVLHPDFVVENFWFQGAGLPGGLINVSDTVRNAGFADAGPFNVSVYLSVDSTVTTADTLIGTRSAASLAVNQTSSGPWLEYALPMLADGTYYLAAIANPEGLNETVTSNNTGTVLPLTILAPTGCTVDAYEPDSTFSATTNSILVGDAPQAHNFCTDGSDWMKFTAEAGKDYSVRVIPTSGYGSPCAQLYGTDGTTLLAGDCANSPRAVDWHASASGTYYVEVGGSVGNANEYTVQVQLQLPDLVQDLRANWSSVAAGGVLDVTDIVSNPGYATAGPFEIGVYRSADGVVTTADTLAAVRSLPSLSVQAYIWDTNQASHAVSFPKTLATGTYYLGAIADRAGAVAELNEANNTSAPIAVTVTAPSCSWDVYEDDDSPATASAIATGTTQTHNYCDDTVDWVRFTPSADGAYVASSTSSYNLELFAPDGTTRMTPHDTDFYSKLSWIATAGTTYYLKNYSGNGVYSFTVFSCAQDAYEDDDNYGAAKIITTGQTQTRNLCEDGDDWVKFDAVQGTSYTITVTATKGTDFSLDLYDTTGLYAIAYGSMGSGPLKGLLLIQDWIAPSTGTYYIHVDPVWGFGRNLDYTLSLN